MEHRKIADRDVSAIGLGAMPMSVAGRGDHAQSIRTIHASLTAGVTLIDTADAYCMDSSEFGHNETLIAEALRHWGGDSDDVLVATKGGHTRGSDGS
ncbi:MAG: aldo/keto reductase, partial [Mycobacteriaceae bacterium]